MTTCRFCAEPIQDAALVCPHCRRDLAPPKLSRGIRIALVLALWGVLGLGAMAIAALVILRSQGIKFW